MKQTRAYERLSIAIPIFILGNDENGKSFIEFAMVVNVGAGGALIAHRRFLRTNEKVSLEIPCVPYFRTEVVAQTVTRSEAVVLRGAMCSTCHLTAVRFAAPIPFATKMNPEKKLSSRAEECSTRR